MQLEGSEGGDEGREQTGQVVQGLVGHMEDGLPHPSTQGGGSPAGLEAEKGWNLTQVLTGALWWLRWGRQTGVRLGARGLGQTGLFHSPNCARSWRLSLSSVYR